MDGLELIATKLDACNVKLANCVTDRTEKYRHKWSFRCLLLSGNIVIIFTIIATAWEVRGRFCTSNVLILHLFIIEICYLKELCRVVPLQLCLVYIFFYDWYTWVCTVCFCHWSWLEPEYCLIQTDMWGMWTPIIFVVHSFWFHSDVWPRIFFLTITKVNGEVVLPTVVCFWSATTV